MLQSWYASKSAINELSALNNLFNVELNRNLDMGDHILTLEAQSLRLVPIDSSLFESIKVVLLIALLPNMS